MTSWKKPTPEIVDKALASVKKETDRQYFFTRLKNPLWLPAIVVRGYFESPPQSVPLADGSTQHLYWPELAYLKNIASEVPGDVVKVLLGIPKVDNPGVNQGILNAVLELPGEHSAQLKERVLECANSFSGFLHFSLEQVLNHWIKEDQVSAALELLGVLVKFTPDPASAEKQKRRRENPDDMYVMLQPSPAFDSNVYQTLLNGEVRKLAEQEPYLVARLLLDATAEMIQLRTHFDHSSKEDFSEIWCPRLSGKRENSNYMQAEATLVQALAHACERVFEVATDRVPELDLALRGQRWKLFQRLRLHLYSLYPNEQTRDWIREAITGHENYGNWIHQFEFQGMVQRACDTFGSELVEPEELERIFEIILGGPPRDRYESRIEEDGGAEWYTSLSESFHRKQLRPFRAVLFGKYLEYFEKLENGSEEAINDEDYLRRGVASGGWVRKKSPRTEEELSQLPDEDILTFINEWDEEQPWYARRQLNGTPGEESFLEEINVSALAKAFQSVARDVIITDDHRFSFWVGNRHRIERPIFVKAMVEGMRESLVAKNFSRLGQFLDFCQWVLEHPDQNSSAGRWDSDQDKDDPGWYSSRRAVGDFVGSCLSEDVEAPLSFRKELASILKLLCEQPDWRLDNEDAVTSDHHDYLTEAINNTRSRALEDVVNFGFWLRRSSQVADIAEVTDILETRFRLPDHVPLTLPERAILALNYSRILRLDDQWAAQNRSYFFPQEELSPWAVAFGTYLRFTHPNLPCYSVLKSDYEFAVESLGAASVLSHGRTDFADLLGQHLFSFYVWGEYQLTGDGSLIEGFYEAVGSDSGHCATLFDHVGRTLRNTPKPLSQDLAERIFAFFERRLEVALPGELQNFSLWLEAECLDEEWRLKSYFRILDRGLPSGARIYGEVRSLEGLLASHPALVVECFAKLTEQMDAQTFQISSESARSIIGAGLADSSSHVRGAAQRARESLLRKGRFELLELEV